MDKGTDMGQILIFFFKFNLSLLMRLGLSVQYVWGSRKGSREQHLGSFVLLIRIWSDSVFFYATNV